MIGDIWTILNLKELAVLSPIILLIIVVFVCVPRSIMMERERVKKVKEQRLAREQEQI